jgi:hypothetical protein
MNPRPTLLSLLPLFLVSFATVGFEIALTRYFAVAKWSEYGYWVISIVLAGFALSGVVMALARDAFARHGATLLRWLPPVLILSAAIGYRGVTTIPFNPLQLQNQATLWPQLANIGLYYLALLPFFFLGGLYISLTFVLNPNAIGRVYGFDLVGAGLGALAALALMFAVPPFALVPCLIVPLALAACLNARAPILLSALLALAASETLLIADDQADFNDYKAIYAPLHVPDSQTVATIRSPRGLYMLLDDFTERVDTDVSNNAALLGLPGPPTSFGLYRDGNRLAALPRGQIDARYAGATLAALPYMLRPKARVLLAGTSGGFRVAELAALGVKSIDAVEPEPIIRGALQSGLGPSPALASIARILPDSPIAAAQPGRYDIIDLSADFLDTAETNTAAFATEALASYLAALPPDGLLSLPVSIREFPAYAVRMLATTRAALLARGITDPQTHVLVIRSAWNVRILVSPTPIPAKSIAAAQAFAEARSFDLSYFPGIDVEAARANIFNDLPAVSFASGSVTSGEGAHDAIAEEAGPVLRGEPTESAAEFDLAPITYDRPAFYAVLRLDRLALLLQRLELLPQQEIGPLINLAVLAQAILIAAIVLAVPALGGRRLRTQGRGVARPILYFSALGLGFLFLEIFLIERASFYLNDRTSGFALVLTAMLIFSGLGSMLENRFESRPHRAVTIAVVIVMLWGITMWAFLQPFLLATLDLPWAIRAGLVMLAVAPPSIALGLPFPLGLSRMGNGGFLPWAWGLNGAFSVVSTPLANLIALQFGYDRVLLAALLLYVLCVIAFPKPAKDPQEWPTPA